jgi:hypothetical protein
MKLNRSTAFRAVPHLALLLGFFAYGPSVLPVLAGTKTLSGKIRDVQDRVLTIEEKKTLATTVVVVEIDSRTKITGELVPGMIIKLKYFEEKAAPPTEPDPVAVKEGEPHDAKSDIRRIATQIKTWPEYSSRRDRKAAPNTQP